LYNACLNKRFIKFYKKFSGSAFKVIHPQLNEKYGKG
jgi:hypothetical protein